MEKLIKKPSNLKELLECQVFLEDHIKKERHNGFIPRFPAEVDLFLALDDEIQEWLKELPNEFNFKFWKKHKYIREDELKEFADILFFILQIVNRNRDLLFYHMEKIFDNFNYKASYLNYEIIQLKKYIWDFDIIKAFEHYIYIAHIRGISKTELLDSYWNKFVYNLSPKRINFDWSL